MTIGASGRAALILATGLLVGFAAPSQATAKTSDTAGAKTETSAAAVSHPRSAARHWKKHAHRSSGKIARRPAGDGKADAGDDGDRPSAIPAAVANANAELTSDTPTGNAARAIAGGEIAQAAGLQPAAESRAVADTQIVAADQLNDVDRALQGPSPATSPTSAAPAPAAAGSDNSAWNQTSLIGRIFIGFGALLTMASAARMFMA